MTTTAVPITTIPEIDMAQDDHAVSSELMAALTTIGFATLQNHGVETALLEKALDASKAFFSLSEDDKQQCAYQGHESNRGYIACGKETHDGTVGSETEKITSAYNADAKETYDINPDDSYKYQQPWPMGLDHFEQDLTEYFHRMDQLHLHIMRLIAVGLKVPPEFFLERCNQRHENLRLLHYPEIVMPQNRNDNSEPIVRGNVHTDFGTITLLTQDSVGGLRVRRLDGEWIFVPPRPHQVVVNVGDMLQRWSNDVLKANPHQVVQVRKDDNDGESPMIVPERYSIAFFCNANKNTMLECLESCVSDERPAKYEPINAFDYLTMRLAKTIDSS